MRRTLLRYLLVGCVNTAVGLGLIFLCMYALHMRTATANLTGYAVGILVSYLLNKHWTFAHRGTHLPALIRFLAVLLIAYLANLGTVLLVDQLGVGRYWAQVSGVIPYTLVGYVGSRWFAFRAPSDVPVGAAAAESRE